MNYQIFIHEKKLSFAARAAIEEYIKRLSPYCSVSVYTEKELKKGTKKQGNCNASERVFFLPDTSGRKTVSSEAFAEYLNALESSGHSEAQYYIGFPIPPSHEGVTVHFLSSMTLSNEVAAIALAEQIYRGYTINHHISYHK